MKTILLATLLFFGYYSFAQKPRIYDNIRLEQASDYKSADTFALEASKYLLSTPFEENDINRIRSLRFIIRWMNGTPDHSFTIDELADKLMKVNEDLLGLYMAAMTKYSLENPGSSKDQRLVKLNALTLVLNYCEDANNNIKMTKQLKKLSEAKAKGELEQSVK